MPEPFNASTWLVDRHVDAGNGKRVAILTGDLSVTYEELLGLVGAVAAGLRKLGVRPEERVALMLRDSLEYATAFLGTMRMGAVALPFNPLLPTPDAANIISDGRARIAIVHGDAANAVGLPQAAPDLVHVVTAGASSQVPGATSWSDLIAWGRDGDTSVAPTITDSPGFWLCTSGTTGKPKLAMHRHADARTICEGYATEILAITASDRAFSPSPAFHAYGLGNSLFFPLSAGASVVLEPTFPPQPEVVADLVRRHRPTLFFSNPTFYARLLATDLPADTFAAVRQGVSAAEALPAEIFSRFRERFGVEILDGIGSTEMTHIFLSNRRGEAVPGTSGKPVSGHRLRILDDDGAEVADGEPGQLWVKGDAAALGYWCRAEQTRSTFVGEWVRTGDVYSRDSQGIYRHLGRRDDMFKSSGEWVSPGEVEDVLLGHPAIAEVAVVAGIDPNGLTSVVAFYVEKAGQHLEPGELIEHCRGKMAGFKRPRQAVRLGTLPKTATGKVRRNELRELARTSSGAAVPG